MSKKAITHVFRLTGMSCHEKAILFTMATKYDDSKGCVQMTAPQIAKWACMAVNTCRRNLKKLEADGRIQIIKGSQIKGFKYVLLGMQKKGDTDALLEHFFEDFWQVYPRKSGKQIAKKAFFTLDPSPDLVVAMLTDISERIIHDWYQRETRYIPHASSYLNQRQWEDPIDKGDGPDGERGFVW